MEANAISELCFICGLKFFYRKLPTVTLYFLFIIIIL